MPNNRGGLGSRDGLDRIESGGCEQGQAPDCQQYSRHDAIVLVRVGLANAWGLLVKEKPGPNQERALPSFVLAWCCLQDYLQTPKGKGRTPAISHYSIQTNGRIQVSFILVSCSRYWRQIIRQRRNWERRHLPWTSQENGSLLRDPFEEETGRDFHQLVLSQEGWHKEIQGNCLYSSAWKHQPWNPWPGYPLQAWEIHYHWREGLKGGVVR